MIYDIAHTRLPLGHAKTDNCFSVSGARCYFGCISYFSKLWCCSDIYFAFHAAQIGLNFYIPISRTNNATSAQRECFWQCDIKSSAKYDFFVSYFILFLMPDLSLFRVVTNKKVPGLKLGAVFFFVKISSPISLRILTRAVEK